MNDNQATITLFGKEIELEASLAACTIYSNEFYGKVDEPYKGYLMEDLLTLYQECEGENAQKGFQPMFSQGLYRIVWAMGRACNSIKETYPKFLKSIEHAPSNFYEFSQAYKVVVVDLGVGVFFRLPEGQDNTDAPDETETDE